MRRYAAKEKSLMDEVAGIARALNKGHEQEIQDGKLAERIQLVCGMPKKEWL